MKTLKSFFKKLLKFLLRRVLLPILVTIGTFIVAFGVLQAFGTPSLFSIVITLILAFVVSKFIREVIRP